MITKELTSQQKWNRKHKSILNKASRKYYYKNRKTILKKQEVRYAKRKLLANN